MLGLFAFKKLIYLLVVLIFIEKESILIKIRFSYLYTELKTIIFLNLFWVDTKNLARLFLKPIEYIIIIITKPIRIRISIYLLLIILNNLLTSTNYFHQNFFTILLLILFSI
jgi:hypothetical protein